jgi:hypothetical protein
MSLPSMICVFVSNDNYIEYNPMELLEELLVLDHVIGEFLAEVLLAELQLASDYRRDSLVQRGPLQFADQLHDMLPVELALAVLAPVHLDDER